MKIVEFLVFCLATWRVSSLLVNEEGPFYVFKRLRESVGIEHDEAGNVFMIPGTFFAGILSCVWCSSMWVGFGWVVFWLTVPWLALLWAMGLAFSAGAILIEGIVRRLEG